MGCLGNLLWFVFGGAVEGTELGTGRMFVVHYDCGNSSRIAMF